MLLPVVLKQPALCAPGNRNDAGETGIHADAMIELKIFQDITGGSGKIAPEHHIRMNWLEPFLDIRILGGADFKSAHQFTSSGDTAEKRHLIIFDRRVLLRELQTQSPVISSTP